MKFPPQTIAHPWEGRRQAGQAPPVAPRMDGARAVKEKRRESARICSRTGQGVGRAIRIPAEKEGRESPSSLGSPRRETGVFRGYLYPTWGPKQAAASSAPAPRAPVAISLAEIRWLELGQVDPSTGQGRQDPTLTVQGEFHRWESRLQRATGGITGTRPTKPHPSKSGGITVKKEALPIRKDLPVGMLVAPSAALEHAPLTCGFGSPMQLLQLAAGGKDRCFPAWDE